MILSRCYYSDFLTSSFGVVLSCTTLSYFGDVSPFLGDSTVGFYYSYCGNINGFFSGGLLNYYSYGGVTLNYAFILSLDSIRLGVLSNDLLNLFDFNGSKPYGD